jgi:hypothetical protein
MERELFEKMIEFLKLKQERGDIINVDVKQSSNGLLFFNETPITHISKGYFKLEILIKNF